MKNSDHCGRIQVLLYADFLIAQALEVSPKRG